MFISEHHLFNLYSRMPWDITGNYYIHTGCLHTIGWWYVGNVHCVACVTVVSICSGWLCVTFVRHCGSQIVHWAVCTSNQWAIFPGLKVLRSIQMPDRVIHRTKCISDNTRTHPLMGWENNGLKTRTKNETELLLPHPQAVASSCSQYSHYHSAQQTRLAEKHSILEKEYILRNQGLPILPLYCTSFAPQTESPTAEGQLGCKPFVLSFPLVLCPKQC